MSELLLPPEHRYAKRIKEQLNEDGSELSMLNLGPTHPATHGIFQNILLMDGERILEAEPMVISTVLLKKLLKTVRFTKSHHLQTE